MTDGIFWSTKLYVILQTEHSLHGSQSQEGHCILMRRYSCMALTNLTFGDSGNKTLLCSLKEFMKSLVAQLQSPSDELRQVSIFIVNKTDLFESL